MKLFKTIILIIIFNIIILGCSKYEEGPFISFRSKKERIAGEW